MSSIFKISFIYKENEYATDVLSDNLQKALSIFDKKYKGLPLISRDLIQVTQISSLSQRVMYKLDLVHIKENIQVSYYVFFKTINTHIGVFDYLKSLNQRFPYCLCIGFNQTEV